MKLRHQERLWKEYLRDPSQWWDLRKNKVSPMDPDFKNKITKEPLWISRLCNLNMSMQGSVNILEVHRERMPTPTIDPKTNLQGPNSTQRKQILVQSTFVEEFFHIIYRCQKEKDLSNLFLLLDNIYRSGLDTHVILANKLVSTMVDIGALLDAQSIFDRLVICDEASWNCMISSHVKSGNLEYAFDLYEKMQHNNSIHLHVHSFVVLLKACCSSSDLERGIELHAEILRVGVLKKDLFIGSVLVDLYVESDLIDRAQEILEKAPKRDTFLWNALIGGYIKVGCDRKVIDCLDKMHVDDVAPDGVTFTYVLKACKNMGDIVKGQEMHAEVERKGLIQKDCFLSCTLMYMYAKTGFLIKAQEVFDQLHVQDVVSWTILISAYVECGLGDRALDCYRKMQSSSVSPNAVTLISSVKACSYSGLDAADQVGKLHVEIENIGLLERDKHLGNTLLDIYAKCGSISKAQEVFDKLSYRNEVSWTALMSGYADHGCAEEALKCFDQMQQKGVAPDIVTFICMLNACSRMGAMEKGQELHTEIERNGMVAKDEAIGNALVDMYARCGYLSMAQRVFEILPVRSIVSWNSLITGYAQVGDSTNVFCTFERMLRADVKPDFITFLGVLDVCSLSSLFSEGEMYFDAMSKEYGMVPALEHHTCMVDLFSRAGLFENAVALIKKLPVYPDLALWHTVLGACRNSGCSDIGIDAFNHTLCWDKMDDNHYMQILA